MRTRLSRTSHRHQLSSAPRRALALCACFVYALAKHRDQALLFVGDASAPTDLAAALPR